MIRLPAALAVALLLAGCTASNGGDGQTASGDGSLVYNGASTGSDEARVACAGSATMHWEGNLGSGQVDVRVLDGAGVQKLSILYSTAGPSSDSKPAFGEDGEWTLRVERRADPAHGTWSGQYLVHLAC